MPKDMQYCPCCKKRVDATQLCLAESHIGHDSEYGVDTITLYVCTECGVVFDACRSNLKSLEED